MYHVIKKLVFYFSFLFSLASNPVSINFFLLDQCPNYFSLSNSLSLSFSFSSAFLSFTFPYDLGIYTFNRKFVLHLRLAAGTCMFHLDLTVFCSQRKPLHTYKQLSSISLSLSPFSALIFFDLFLYNF